MFDQPPLTLGTAALLLLAFGVIYNAAVSWLERRGYTEGYIFLLVIGGVVVTLLIVVALDPKAAVLSFLAFSCSGLPMVLGSWWRHVTARARGQDAQRREALRLRADHD
jgi:hypothetical protein